MSFKLFKHTPKPASFERIRIRLLSKWLLNKNNSCPVIAFTEKSPREGVSTIVAGLAKSFSLANTGKILVLDVSNCHHNHCVDRLLNITKRVDCSDSPDMPDHLKRDEALGIDVLTLVDDNHNTGAETNISSLLEKLKKIYSIILIDAGTLNNSKSAYWLINSDFNVLIIDSTKTTQESLKFLKKEFEHSDIVINGSILNKRKFHIPSFLYWLTR